MSGRLGGEPHLGLRLGREVGLEVRIGVGVGVRARVNVKMKGWCSGARVNQRPSRRRAAPHC